MREIIFAVSIKITLIPEQLTEIKYNDFFLTMFEFELKFQPPTSVNAYSTPTFWGDLSCVFEIHLPLPFHLQIPDHMVICQKIKLFLSHKLFVLHLSIINYTSKIDWSQIVSRDF